MELLILGLAIWVIAHFFPVLMPVQREAIRSKLGAGLYKGLFALVIIGSIVLIVQGWKGTIPTQIYVTGMGFRHAAMSLVALAFILFVAAKVKSTRIKRFIRHPQLTGLVIWAAAHLLANGDSRSLILFTTLGIWAILSIILINRRDGQWQKPDSVIGWPMELLIVIGGIVLTGIFFKIHIYLAGVALM